MGFATESAAPRWRLLTLRPTVGPFVEPDPPPDGGKPRFRCSAVERGQIRCMSVISVQWLEYLVP